ncbi:hypothetical protein EYF80_045382 [Liparis tanakae]|uniref:Uncharacterized protein n=1 Tax=Liparis tanakae TaxID=230148 RepID=A0A4Z2FTB8_9TELE|nr:hypothetical protein EYF80_045382 [Liparis tanakae]
MRFSVRAVTVMVNVWSRISLYSSLLNSWGFQVFFRRAVLGGRRVEDRYRDILNPFLEPRLRVGLVLDSQRLPVDGAGGASGPVSSSFFSSSRARLQVRRGGREGSSLWMTAEASPSLPAEDPQQEANSGWTVQQLTPTLCSTLVTPAIRSAHLHHNHSQEGESRIHVEQQANGPRAVEELRAEQQRHQAGGQSQQGGAEALHHQDEGQQAHRPPAARCRTKEDERLLPGRMRVGVRDAGGPRVAEDQGPAVERVLVPVQPDHQQLTKQTGGSDPHEQQRPPRGVRLQGEADDLHEVGETQKGQEEGRNESSQRLKPAAGEGHAAARRPLSPGPGRRLDG